MDDRAAEVICRQMGFTVGRLLELSIVIDGTNQIWLDNLNCSTWPSDETHVEQCVHNNNSLHYHSAVKNPSVDSNWQWGTNDCGHTQDVGVGCDAADSTSTADA